MTARKRRITRRDFLSAVGAASMGTVLGGRTARAAPARGAKPGRPNILWLTCEDMSATLGCYGDSYARTPNIDRLAAESVRYTHAFATAPVCSPVRSCLITGVVATSLGTQNLRSRFAIPSDMKGFPSYLRREGYFCSNNVKTDYNTRNEREIIRASWDQCSRTAHWRGRKAGQPFFCVFNDTTTHQSRTMVWPYKQFQDKVQKRLRPAERHDPATAPLPPYYPDTPVTRRTVARYYDCVRVMDQNVGKRLKELADDGLAEDTIVFFYSDHGAGMPRHKRLILDSGLHVPLLVRFPKKYRHLAPAGADKTVDRLVSFVDFPPTVLSLVGLPIPEYMQGRPFLGKSAGKPREYVYGARDRVDEAYDLARCIRDRRYLYVRNFMPHLSYNQPSFYSDLGEIRREITRLAAEGKLTTAPQKHYAGPTRAVEELYDTQNDPKQIRNLAASPEHKPILEKMRKLLGRWMIETRDVGLMPETILWERIKDATPYDAAKQADKYPQQRILAAADLVGRGTEALGEQIKLLEDPDAAVRYWAAVGAAALGAKAAPAVTALRKALADASASVRIESAAALCGLGQAEGALDLLAKELRSGARGAALHAARALQLLGQAARPALPAMKAALQAARTGKGQDAMYIRFGLDPAVKKLEPR